MATASSAVASASEVEISELRSVVTQLTERVNKLTHFAVSFQRSLQQQHEFVLQLQNDKIELQRSVQALMTNAGMLPAPIAAANIPTTSVVNDSTSASTGARQSTPPRAAAAVAVVPASVQPVSAYQHTTATQPLAAPHDLTPAVMASILPFTALSPPRGGADASFAAHYSAPAGAAIDPSDDELWQFAHAQSQSLAPTALSPVKAATPQPQPHSQPHPVRHSRVSKSPARTAAGPVRASWRGPSAAPPQAPIPASIHAPSVADLPPSANAAMTVQRSASASNLRQLQQQRLALLKQQQNAMAVAAGGGVTPDGTHASPPASRSRTPPRSGSSTPRRSSTPQPQPKRAASPAPASPAPTKASEVRKIVSRQRRNSNGAAAADSRFFYVQPNK